MNTPADKQKEQSMTLKLVTTLLSAVTPLAAEDPASERARLCEDMEAAVGYVDAANPGLLKTRAFFAHFKMKLPPGVHRRLHDEINGRPNVRAALATADQGYAAYVRDLTVDNTAGQNADADKPDYAPWWQAFRPLFTGVTTILPWHVIQYKLFHNPSKAMKKR